VLRSCAPRAPVRLNRLGGWRLVLAVVVRVAVCGREQVLWPACETCCPSNATQQPKCSAPAAACIPAACLGGKATGAGFHLAPARSRACPSPCKVADTSFSVLAPAKSAPAAKTLASWNVAEPATPSSCSLAPRHSTCTLRSVPCAAAATASRTLAGSRPVVHSVAQREEGSIRRKQAKQRTRRAEHPCSRGQTGWPPSPSSRRSARS
jgi:hypothetical protein